MTFLVKHFLSNSEDETKKIARRILKEFPARIIGLSGDLGAGKTVFCKGFFSALGIQQENIVSPSFNIVNMYEKGNKKFYHIDLYRYSHFEDDFGFWDILSSNNYVLIEWAERLGEDIVELDQLIEIKVVAENKRSIDILKFKE